MAEITLRTLVREERGKGAARKLRQQGLVPAIIYGHGFDPVPLAVDAREMADVLKKAGESTVIELNMKPSKGRATKAQALIKEVQFEPRDGHILHVDFLHVRKGERITTHVPVVAVGEAPGAKAGGILENPLWELEIECLPEDLPHEIKVDVSKLQIGGSIHVGDITLPEGVRAVTSAETVVFHVVPPRVEKEVAVEAGEAEVLLAGAGEPAEPEVIGKGKKEVEGREEEAEGEGGKGS